MTAVAAEYVVSPRGRVRVRLGPVLVEWRVARVKAAPSPPNPGLASRWGPVDDGNGLPGYGQRGADGQLVSWRPLPRGTCGWPPETPGAPAP